MRDKKQEKTKKREEERREKKRREEKREETISMKSPRPKQRIEASMREKF